eukprot:6178799-Pleurochrysis_carterae.AAC.2
MVFKVPISEPPGVTITEVTANSFCAAHLQCATILKQSSETHCGVAQAFLASPFILHDSCYVSSK